MNLLAKIFKKRRRAFSNPTLATVRFWVRKVYSSSGNVSEGPRGQKSIVFMSFPYFPKIAPATEASQLCRFLLQGDGVSDLPLLASNPLLATIQFYRMARQSRPKALSVGVLEAPMVFPKLRRCVCKGRPCPLTSGGTTSGRSYRGARN